MTAWQSVAVVVGLLVLGLAALASVHARRDRRRARRGWVYPVVRQAIERARDFDRGLAGVNELLSQDPAELDAACREVADRVRREILDPEYCALCDGPCRRFAGHPGGDEVRASALRGESPLAQFAKPPPDFEVRLRELKANGLAAAIDRDLLGIKVPNCRCTLAPVDVPLFGHDPSSPHGRDVVLAYADTETQVAELARLYELDEVDHE